VPEIIEKMKPEPKRGKGRPSIPDKFAILDSCATVIAKGGHYTRLAPQFKLSTKQLTDLVQKNRTYVNRKIDALRKNP
jgi:hypothetical protein